MPERRRDMSKTAIAVRLSDPVAAGPWASRDRGKGPLRPAVAADPQTTPVMNRLPEATNPCP